MANTKDRIILTFAHNYCAIPTKTCSVSLSDFEALFNFRSEKTTQVLICKFQLKNFEWKKIFFGHSDAHSQNRCTCSISFSSDALVRNIADLFKIKPNAEQELKHMESEPMHETDWTAISKIAHTSSINGSHEKVDESFPKGWGLCEDGNPNIAKTHI